jgi:hypothetical protein
MKFAKTNHLMFLILGRNITEYVKHVNPINAIHGLSRKFSMLSRL